MPGDSGTWSCLCVVGRNVAVAGVAGGLGAAACRLVRTATPAAPAPPALPAATAARAHRRQVLACELRGGDGLHGADVRQPHHHLLLGHVDLADHALTLRQGDAGAHLGEDALDLDVLLVLVHQAALELAA